MKLDAKDEVPLIHSMPMESENNVYLKHPGDPDEEMSEEERDFDREDESREQESFANYVKRRGQINDDKVAAASQTK